LPYPLWDCQEKFDKQHEDWQFDGPSLNLEFSRVSKESRCGALTLVIDAQNGNKCPVAYAFSKRETPDKAINDLITRERTTNKKNIGRYFANKSQKPSYRDKHSFEIISEWAENKNIDVVIWTDFESNFFEITNEVIENLKNKISETSFNKLKILQKNSSLMNKRLSLKELYDSLKLSFTKEEIDIVVNYTEFSIQRALLHIQTLNAKGKAKAIEYVMRAPKFIDTRLQKVLQSQPLFSEYVLAFLLCQVFHYYSCWFCCMWCNNKLYSEGRKISTNKPAEEGAKLNANF